jgi:hypothetical protein
VLSGVVVIEKTGRCTVDGRRAGRGLHRQWLSMTPECLFL